MEGGETPKTSPFQLPALGPSNSLSEVCSEQRGLAQQAACSECIFMCRTERQTELQFIRSRI